MDKLNPNDPRPHYAQIAEVLAGEVREGSHEGQKLPTHQEVAERFSVSVGTVKRAYAQLQDDGLIVTRQGQGAYVVTPLPEQPAGDPAPDLARIYDQIAGVRRVLDGIERELRTHG
ncbi:regulatory GntR family protein [Amycolatopsis sulphurea]|uniref:Regulatory GntR family protein n=1 Tax=Amycolatopsis sulphurea TaxID=76022 RepID=A0A2A9G1U8_9PSEU|nr:GntR family transcriptional regulator [Amycolatopsis sulphurea]PFG56926.1 regulatory GntR family protein [Amycolatopsis sulphurea]